MTAPKTINQKIKDLDEKTGWFYSDEFTDRPQFFIRTLDITGEISLPEGIEMVMPGDNVTITVELIYPTAINEGLQFAIREGGRTVGAGQVTKLID